MIYGKLTPEKMGLSIQLPEGSCDCHHHIFDHRFPYVPEDKRNLPEATFNDYTVFKKNLGIKKHIIVQPSPYGTDNSCLLDALAHSNGLARGEAVIDLNTTEYQLQEMDNLGVTGIRFNFSAGKAVDVNTIVTLSDRVLPFGWHVQLHGTADILLELKSVISKIRNRIVIDHYGRIAVDDISGNQLRFISELIDEGKTWIKCSAPYHLSFDKQYSDIAPLVRYLASFSADRLLWGSDWPHPSEISAGKPIPNDIAILEQFYMWLDDDRVRQKVFVENPTNLFFRR